MSLIILLLIHGATSVTFGDSLYRGLGSTGVELSVSKEYHYTHKTGRPALEHKVRGIVIAAEKFQVPVSEAFLNFPTKLSRAYQINKQEVVWVDGHKALLIDAYNLVMNFSNWILVVGDSQSTTVVEGLYTGQKASQETRQILLKAHYQTH